MSLKLSNSPLFALTVKELVHQLSVYQDIVDPRSVLHCIIFTALSRLVGTLTSSVLAPTFAVRRTGNEKYPRLLLRDKQTSPPPP